MPQNMQSDQGLHCLSERNGYFWLTLLHSERPKLYAILAFLGAIGLKKTKLKKKKTDAPYLTNGLIQFMRTRIVQLV